jgi:hypothetical protein
VRSGANHIAVLAALACGLSCATPRVQPPPGPLSGETAAATQPAPVAGAVTFAGSVRPLLEAKCQPCHFRGGKMYARLPFDQEMTIRLLGEKLFTRLQKPDDQAMIRAFLAQAAGPGS